MRTYFLLLLLVCGLVPSDRVFAHGLATSQKKVVVPYLIEFEYNQLGNPAAGDFISYNFDILNDKTLEFHTFKSVFVRFARNGDKDTIANGTLAPDQFSPKNARMGVNLPEAGAYTVTVRFYDEKDDEMASTVFDLQVDPPYNNRSFISGAGGYLWAISLIAGALLGLAGARLLHTFQKKDT